MMDSSRSCKGITASGENCKSKAGDSGYCYMHDPKLIAEREEQQREDKRALTRQNQLVQIREQERQEKYQLVKNAIIEMQRELRDCAEAERRHQLLESVTKGLYLELDKLTKKAPAESVTELALSQINEVINDTKDLMKDDPYIQRLQAFVPAGDMPENRDALLALGQVKQGLERFSDGRRKTIADRMVDAKIVEAALRSVLNDNDGVAVLKDVEHELYNSSFKSLPDKWIRQQDKYPHMKEFDLERLDSFNPEAELGADE